jgi:hypothetical protein
MKLYYFNPNDYGAEFFVMVENKINAHEFLLKHLENKIITEICASEMYEEDLEIWNYTLEEHPIGSVIESEIA